MLSTTFGLICLALLMVLGGCFGYQIGPDSLYRPDIRTIRVPVFRSESFRRFLGERLTEAVIKEIHQKTAYRVVQSPDADSEMQGRLVDERKTVVAENRFDEPRVLEVDLYVEVIWIDRQGGTIMQRELAVPSILLSPRARSTFVPEAGQSIATAQQRAIQELAAQIVAQMERAW